MIDRGAVDGQKEFYTALNTELRTHIDAHASDFSETPGKSPAEGSSQAQSGGGGAADSSKGGHAASASAAAPGGAGPCEPSEPSSAPTPLRGRTLMQQAQRASLSTLLLSLTVVVLLLLNMWSWRGRPVSVRFASQHQDVHQGRRPWRPSHPPYAAHAHAPYDISQITYPSAPSHSPGGLSQDAQNRAPSRGQKDVPLDHDLLNQVFRQAMQQALQGRPAADPDL